MTSAITSTCVSPSTPRHSCPHPVAQRPPSPQKLSVKIPRLRTRPWRWGVLTRESPRLRTRGDCWSMPTSQRLRALSCRQPEIRQPYTTQATHPRKRCTRAGVHWARACSPYIAGPSRTTGKRDSCGRLSSATSACTRRTRHACVEQWRDRHATSSWSSWRHDGDAVWAFRPTPQRGPPHRHVYWGAAHRHCGWKGRLVRALCHPPRLVPHLLPKYSRVVPIHRRCASWWARVPRPGAKEAGASGGAEQKKAKFMTQWSIN